MPIRLPLTVLLALLLSFTASSAQTVPEPPVHATLTFIGVGSSFSDLYLSGTQGDVSVRAQFWSLSEPVLYVGPREAILYRDRKTQEGGVQHIPMGKLSLPPLGGNFLVFLKRTPDSPTPVSTFLLDNSLSAHPAGDARMVNLTGKKLACKFGDKQAVLVPGHDELYPGGSGNSIQTYRLLLFKDKDGQWAKLTAARVRMGSKTRLLLVCERTFSEKDGVGYAVHRIRLPEPVQPVTQ